LEDELLGVERTDDVPGELIPALYFDYLRTGDPTRMERVFYHNRLDILSLVSLTVLTHRLLSDASAACRRDGNEQYSLGRIHMSRGRFEEAAACYAEALQSCSYSELEWEILRDLSMVHKKQEKYLQCVENWKEMITLDPQRDLFPYIELAKYYEHREREYDRAADYAARAFGVAFLSPAEEEEIRHRLTRLQRKRERL
jgi:tetratricopeptide (TPR) repeat protein